MDKVQSRNVSRLFGYSNNLFQRFHQLSINFWVGVILKIPVYEKKFLVS